MPDEQRTVKAEIRSVAMPISSSSREYVSSQRLLYFIYDPSRLEQTPLICYLLVRPIGFSSRNCRSTLRQGPRDVRSIKSPSVVDVGIARIDGIVGAVV